MSSTCVPQTAQIVVIGGGPGGSYAASALAREGFDVVLLEKEHFPRYHIGESMIPSCRPLLRFIDAEEKMKKYGFTLKPGAAFKFSHEKREGYTDFLSISPGNHSWNVIRSEFDNLLFEHAKESGAKTFEGISVTDIQFSSEDRKTPVSLKWKAVDSDAHVNQGSVSFDYLVDASGRTGIMTTKYLKTRKFNQSLKNVAFWGYWEGAAKYSPGTLRENAPFFEALIDETGWAWLIPLHDGTVSVGVVLEDHASKTKKSELPPSDDMTKAHYLKQLELAPELLKFLTEAEFQGKVRSAADYSYSSSESAGPRYRIIGDAAAFIDPLFSSGVHLALTGALAAASTISASIRGHCTEEQSIEFHNSKVMTAYTRFLIVVMGVYKQIKSLFTPVLSDIDEDNYDRAFHFLRPVIQGAAAETEPTLSEEELKDTISFCQHAMGPRPDDMSEALKTRLKELDPKYTSLDGDVIDAETIQKVAGDDEETKAVLLKVNSRRAIGDIVNSAQQGSLSTEVMGGFVINLKHGELGLRKA